MHWVVPNILEFTCLLIKYYIILCYIILENLLFAQVMKLNGNLTDIRVWKVFHKHKDQCKTTEAESGSSFIYYIITG